MWSLFSTFSLRGSSAIVPVRKARLMSSMQLVQHMHHTRSRQAAMLCSRLTGMRTHAISTAFAASARTADTTVESSSAHASAYPATAYSLIPYQHSHRAIGAPSRRIFPANHIRTQYRCFDSRRMKKRKKAKNPFKVLGIKHGSTYKDVKKRFLHIAMKNHPDTASADDESEQDRMREIFIAARIAFESLVEGPDGVAVLKSEQDNAMDNFDSWFRHETGFDTPFQFDMDPQTMKEVASMTDDMSVGLDRDGGMWTLAKMVTSAVKSGGDSAAILRIDAGDVKDDKATTGLRRRRRRRF